MLGLDNLVIVTATVLQRLGTHTGYHKTTITNIKQTTILARVVAARK